jgi:alpha-N-arabinofuranosidase
VIARAFVSLLACVSLHAAAAPVTFDWFEYTGRDAVFGSQLPAGSYRNPILAGFYPDPSVTRVGNKFYLVNSTFAYFPAIPIFESEDLVHWRQIGHVIDRPSQLKLEGLGVSRGVFAPTIQYHNGTFYVVNTSVDGGGNFYVTARNPAGPWSDPIWLRGIEGIDPSFFFDSDGTTYLLNNGAPVGKPLYNGHRAIWMQKFDVATRKPVGPRRVVLNGGVDLSKQPVWIEGPHLYKRQDWYYLVCAEGGTGPNHSQVALRSRSPWGPYHPSERNPILTQRDLPADRADPITNSGHADLIEAPDRTWWAVFLGSRVYDRVHYNTGRETYLLPVTWIDGWPIILNPKRNIPYVALGPKFMKAGEQKPLSGNFTWRDNFDSPTLDFAWVQLRTPKQKWFELRNTGVLAIEPQRASLDSLENPSFLARRQQHLAFDASTAMTLPADASVAAGIAAFQGERYWYFLGARRHDGRIHLFLEKNSGGNIATLAMASVADSDSLKLRISGQGRAYSFFYDADRQGWKALKENDDGSILSTEVAGGFVGAVLGLHARVQ